MRSRVFFAAVSAMALGLSAVAPVVAADVGPTSVGTVAPPDVKALGDAAYFGATNSVTFNQPIVGIAGTRSSRGYWEAATDGGVFGFGDAHFYGSMAGKALDQPVVGIAAPRSGKGYWLAAGDGGVFAWGGAPRLGDAEAADVSKPVVGIASTRRGAGFWVVGRGTPATLPGQVTVVRAGHGGGSGEIELAWTGVPGATGYRIERADIASGPFSVAADVNLTSGTATMVGPGVANIGAIGYVFYPPNLATHGKMVASRQFGYVEYPVVGFTFRRHNFRVTTYNGNGDGPSSVVVCGTPIGDPPC